MTTKVYRLMGIDTAMHLLRPGASWEISNNYFTRWGKILDLAPQLKKSMKP